MCISISACIVAGCIVNPMLLSNEQEQKFAEDTTETGRIHSNYLKVISKRTMLQ